MSGGAVRLELSVLLPVHDGVDPEHLRTALESLTDQTFSATEIVVVEDGPLSAGHRRHLDALALPHTEVRRLRLPERSGIAVALQTGMKAACFPWIARMDSDDIALPWRWERQAAVLARGDTDVLGSAMYEFRDDPRHTVGTRRMPETHLAISRYMRRANPMNHPTVVLRRDLALEAGGYRPLPGLEDYDLFARMLATGGRFANLAEPLLLFRADGAMFRRRRGSGMLRSEITLQRNLNAYGIIGPARAISNTVARTTFRLLPPRAMEAAYRHLFHDRRGTR